MAKKITLTFSQKLCHRFFVYGGKDNDTVEFKNTITGGLVSGDDGDDIITLEKLEAAMIKGGAGNDPSRRQNFSSITVPRTSQVVISLLMTLSSSLVMTTTS